MRGDFPKNSKIGILASMLIYSLALIWIFTLLIEVTRFREIEDWALPLAAIGIIFAILLVLTLRLFVDIIDTYNEQFAKDRIVPNYGHMNCVTKGALKQFMKIFGGFESSKKFVNLKSTMIWIGVYPILIFLIGFYIATILFCYIFIYNKTQNRRLAVGYTLGIMAGYYIIFVVILEVFLWRGLIFEGM